MPSFRHIQYLSIASLLLLLAACAGTPPVPEEDLAVTVARMATQKEQTGDFRGAADIWLKEAAKNPTRADAFKLEAAKSLYRGRDINGSTTLVNELLKKTLPNALFIDVRLLAAQIGIDTGQYAIALEALNGLPAAMTENQRFRATRLGMAAHKAAGDKLAYIVELDRLGLLLRTPEQIKANNDQLWAAINALNATELSQLQSMAATPGLSGWVELVTLGRRYALNPIALRNALVEWQSRHPQHLGNFGYIDQLVSQAAQPASYPETITVLLPLSGKLAIAGQAIRTGIMAAYFDLPSGSALPRLDFVDTAKTDALNAYLQALEKGTGAVIGPLTKPELSKIAVSGELPVPVLGLNRLPATIFAPENLFQFGLAPEDDAKAAADRALQESLMRALVLAPNSDWGRRAASSFEQHFNEGGGQTLAVEYFGEKMTDFATPLKALLGLDASQQRKRNVQAITGTKMEFEPRRRQDTDFVFLAATPRQARLIRPLMQFHRASDLPIYASSHVFTGVIDTEADKDMNGLEFCDIGWVIGDGKFAAQRTRVEALWPGSGRQARLQALGFDAFNTLPMLGRLRAAEGDAIDGATGKLSSDANGVVQRQPIWARFDNGVARKVDVVVPPANDG